MSESSLVFDDIKIKGVLNYVYDENINLPETARISLERT